MIEQIAKDNENNQNNPNIDHPCTSDIKKNGNKKKSLKKSRAKAMTDSIKVTPLLKPPNKRRKFNKKGKTINQKDCQSGIIWDNKTIEEQYLDRKLHPRVKIDEPKTPYPDGDDEDIYQEGINNINEIKPTEELINNVVASLNEKVKKKKISKTNEMKKRAYGNEFTAVLKFYHENKEKFEDLSRERKECLANTLINKFHKEVRSLSKGKKNN